jgi:hypothetical protein
MRRVPSIGDPRGSDAIRFYESDAADYRPLVVRLARLLLSGAGMEPRPGLGARPVLAPDKRMGRCLGWRQTSTINGQC